MNFYAFILIIVILYNIVNSANLKEFYMKLLMITLINECFIQIGYFIKIGTSEVSYRTVCELLLLCTSILLICKVKIKRSNFNVSLIFLAICVFGILRIIIQPSNILAANINVSWDDYLSSGIQFENIHFVPYVFLEFFSMFIFIISILTVYSVYTYKELNNFLNSFFKWSKGMLIIGCVEAIIKYIFNSNLYNYVCNFIFGISSSTNAEISSRGTGVILQGLTKEGSHYIYVLFIIIIVLFTEYKNKKSTANKVWLFVAILLSVLAMSFSVLLFGAGIIMIGYFYWIRRSNNIQIKNLKKFILVIIIVIGVLFGVLSATSFINELSISTNDFWSRRIVSLFEELQLIFSGEWKFATTALEWSNRSRLLSVFETMKLIIYRPLFGFGIGSVTSHGSSSMLLAGVGIIGTFYWFKVVFYSQITGISSKYLRKSGYLEAIVIWFIINMLNSMGLRPFYEVSTLVLVLVFRNLFGEKIDEKNKI